MKLFDRDVFNEIRSHAQDLKSVHGVRDSEFDEYEKMYLMDFSAENSEFASQDIMKLTPSPSARNKVLNACRLMMSQEPVFDINASGFDQGKIEAIEKNISRWWDQAGRAARRPLHYDMILSALLYDEMHTSNTIMDDYKAYNKKDKRAERISKMTPILFHTPWAKTWKGSMPIAEYWNMPTLIPQIRTPATVMASLRFISLFIKNSFPCKKPGDPKNSSVFIFRQESIQQSFSVNNGLSSGIYGIFP